MTTTYPLSIPTVGAITSMKWSLVDAVGIGESPYTFSQEVFEHPGKRWLVEATLAGMYRDYAEEWCAFLAQLRGRRGTFLLGEVAGATARGALGGAPLVKGANQTGETLLIDGCSISITNWLRKGDWIQLGTGSTSRMHKSLTDVNTNGSGEATLTLWPGPRTAPADNEVVVTANCKSVFRLASNTRGWDVQSAAIFGISFSAVEAP